MCVCVCLYVCTDVEDHVLRFCHDEINDTLIIIQFRHRFDHHPYKIIVRGMLALALAGSIVHQLKAQSYYVDSHQQVFQKLQI